MMNLPQVDNVYIYIADAVRWDFTPDCVMNLGLSVKTVSSSIHSPSSISSIISGTSVPQHSVGTFSDTISESLPNLLTLSSHQTSFINTMVSDVFSPRESEGIIADTLGTTNSEPKKLEEIKPPFICVERGPGGHAPYGTKKEKSEDGWDYFENSEGQDRWKYVADYKESVKEDSKWFLDRINILEQKDVIDNTIIIYVSDHGELLGESGMLAHSPPIHPNLVYVSTVFIHPEVPNESINNEVISHTDIAPTVISMTNSKFESKISPTGNDIRKSGFSNSSACFYHATRNTPVGTINMKFDSVWDSTGGYVFPKTKLSGRMILALYRLMFGYPWRKYGRANALKHLQFQLSGDRTHGCPELSPNTAKSKITSIYESVVETSNPAKNDVPKNRLKELGYLE